MSKIKSVYTEADVSSYIAEFVDTEQKRKDSYELIELMTKITGCTPRMWGPSIIGFGNYHYRYDSGHEGDAPVVAFAPRRAAISLYVFTGLPEHEYLVSGLGKIKRGKYCIYVKRLSDINCNQLELLMKETIKYILNKYPQ